jgi:hypothetical protein
MMAKRNKTAAIKNLGGACLNVFEDLDIKKP